MPEKPDKEYVIGALAEQYHPPEDIKLDNCLVECHKCHRPMWIMSWNMDKTPVCLECVIVLAKEAAGTGEELTLGITEQDVKTAGDYIKKHPKGGCCG